MGADRKNCRHALVRQNLAQRALFDGCLARFGFFDVAARSQALVAQHFEEFDFRFLAGRFAVFHDLEFCRAALAAFALILITPGFRRGRAPEYEQFADVLHGGCVEAVGQRGQDGFAIVARIAEHADLDECVRGQRGVNFALHGRGKPVAADDDNGVEVMCLRPQFAALGRGEGDLRHTGAYYPGFPARLLQNLSKAP